MQKLVVSWVIFSLPNYPSPYGCLIFKLKRKNIKLFPYHLALKSKRENIITPSLWEKHVAEFNLEVPLTKLPMAEIAKVEILIFPQ